MRAHRFVTVALAVLVLVADASASTWPRDRAARLEALGAGAAVVFSPDFTTPANRQFYERLGFAYFEDTSWERVLDGIRQYNERNRARPVETVILMTHGANGHGLKLQANKLPRGARSYVSLGALQERLEPAGVKLCIVAACNSGRLYRPSIYNTLDPTVKDPLFLPPTQGILNASPKFDPKRSSVRVVRRTANLKENTTEGHAGELSPAVRQALGFPADARSARNARFVVSDLLMQMLMNDPKATVTSAGYTNRIVLEGHSDVHSDRIYERFVRFLNTLAPRRA